MEKNRRRFIKRTVFTVVTDFNNWGLDLSSWDEKADAVRVAAKLAHAHYKGQRNFSSADKKRHRELWKAKDYPGVVEHWGEVMSEHTDHLDIIYVRESSFRVSLDPTGEWKVRAGEQDPEVRYAEGVPTLRRCSVLAEEALRLYAQRTGLAYEGDPEAAISDLLADIKHLCNREGLEFDSLLETARSNYHEEIQGRV